MVCHRDSNFQDPLSMSSTPRQRIAHVLHMGSHGVQVREVSLYYVRLRTAMRAFKTSAAALIVM